MFSKSHTCMLLAPLRGALPTSGLERLFRPRLVPQSSKPLLFENPGNLNKTPLPNRWSTICSYFNLKLQKKQHHHKICDFSDRKKWNICFVCCVAVRNVCDVRVVGEEWGHQCYRKTTLGLFTTMGQVLFWVGRCCVLHLGGCTITSTICGAMSLPYAI